MFSFSFGTRRVAALFGICIALQLGAAFAAPAEFEGLGQKARDVLADLTPMARPVEVRDLEARATPAAPHFVVYADQYQSGVTGPPAVSAVTGFNVFLLSFLLTEGAWDKAYEWTTLSASDRATIKSQYAAAGIKLMVSVFGSTDVPTTVGNDPVATANTIAAWVIQWGLDGVDVDYEDFGAMDSGTAEAWLISFTKQLRSKLPAGDYIITHAPVAPW